MRKEIYCIYTYIYIYTYTVKYVKVACIDFRLKQISQWIGRISACMLLDDSKREWIMSGEDYNKHIV